MSTQAIKVQDIQPGQKGFSVQIKIKSVEVSESRKGNSLFYRGQAGDETGAIDFSILGNYDKEVKVGNVIRLDEVDCEVYRSHMRLKNLIQLTNLTLLPDSTIKSINFDNNVSLDEYELQTQDNDKKRSEPTPNRNNRNQRDFRDNRNRRNDNSFNRGNNNNQNRRYNNDRSYSNDRNYNSGRRQGNPRSNTLDNRGRNFNNQRQGSRYNNNNNNNNNNDRFRGDNRRNQRKNSRSQSQPRKKVQREIDETTVTWSRIGDLVPDHEKFISIEGRILSVTPEKNGFVGKIGDSTGIIDYFFYQNEQIEFKEGVVVKILEGKCKVYDEHPYVSVAGGVLKVSDARVSDVLQSNDVSKQVFEKKVLPEKTSRPDRSKSQTREKTREPVEQKPIIVKAPEFIQVELVRKKRFGFNVRGQVISVQAKDKGFSGRIADATGSIDFYFNSQQLPSIQVGQTLCIRNGGTREFKQEQRFYIFVDQFGKVFIDEENKVTSPNKDVDFSAKQERTKN